GQRNA
ncbi:MAG: hypothetical protein EZS28_051430, partial [Streblomastix strix]